MSAWATEGLRNWSRAMTVPGPGQRPTGQRTVGGVPQRVGAQQDERVDPAVGRRVQDALGVQARRVRQRGPGRGPRVPAVVQGDPAGQAAGSQAGLQRTPHVGPAQHGQEPGRREGGVHGGAGVHDGARGLGQVGPADHHREVPVRGGDHPGRGRELVGRHPGHAVGRDVTAHHGPDHGGDLAGAVLQRRRGVAGQAGAGRGDLHDPGRVLHHRVLQPQEQHRQLLLGVRAHVEHGAAGAAGLVDGGAGQVQDRRGQAVTHLGVDVVGADDALGQLGPGVGGLVGEAGATQHRDGPGALGVQGGGDGAGGGLQGTGPAGRDQLGSLAPHERLGQAVLGVDGLEPEPALVAQPGPVHRVRVHTLVAQHLVAAGLHGDPASHRAGGAGRLGLLQVPGTGPEPVGLGRQRADGADLDGVAGEVRS